jgi:NADPH-dependent curcumin reductase CurA
MFDYLTKAEAATTYQSASDMSNYLTTTDAASTYATKAALSNSITAATIANTDAAQNITVSVSTNGTYSTLSINYANLLTKLNGYLTTASASSTYQTITGMTSYLTTHYSIIHISDHSQYGKLPRILLQL